MLPDPGTLPRPWSDAYPPGVPRSYRYPDVPVTRFLDDAVRDFPTEVALLHAGASWTWTEVVALVDRVASRLLELGVGAGDVVAVVGGAAPATVVSMLAGWRLGATVAALDPTLDAELLAGRLGQVAPRVVVAELDAVGDVLAARPSLPTLEHVVVADRAAWSGRTSRIRAAALGRLGRRPSVAPEDEVVELDDVVTGRRAGRVRQAPLDPATPALLAWPAASVGPTPPVVLTSANLVAAAFQVRLWVPDVRAGREVLLGGVGPSHALGLATGVLWGVLAAASIVLVDRPDGAALVEAVSAHGVSLLTLTPAQADALTRASRSGRSDLGSVRVALAVGAPLRPGVRLAFEEATEGRLRQTFGLTEAAGLTHATPVYGRTEDGTIGLPVTDTVAAVRALDGDGLVGPGVPGELLVAGPQVAADEVGTAWHATGDLAVVDAAGVFRVLGRVRDAVVRDGVFVAPAEVEDALLAHPGVRAATVVATDGGTHLEAVAVTRGRRRVRTGELRTHLEQVLPTTMLPDRLHLVDELPVTAVGLVDRAALRAALEKGMLDSEGRT